MKILKLFYLIATSVCCTVSYAQTKVEEKPNNQPTIMVIPFTSEGINLRDAFENNSLVRVGITKVKEAFDQRGVNTIDLRAKIKQAEASLALQSDQKSSIKDEVINNSGADIYVEVECKPNYSSSGNSVTLIMTAYDTFSAESFANKVANSPKFYTTNFDKLVEKLAETEVPNLLNTIQQKFDDIRVNGRTITVRVGILEGSKLKMGKEIDKDGNLLSDAIEDFIQEKSFKNKYHVQGSTDAQINFDMVKVPMKDAEGNPFRISRFAADFRKFLRTKDLQCTQVINGNSIIFSIK
ncbi:MAG: DUF6175 family protein [Flectobacillus sp.]|uniref:DUF6175 family protein n=1 Tax=Flectobacillus sp. TaxID=50419 RepID=UPI003B9C5C5E